MFYIINYTTEIRKIYMPISCKKKLGAILLGSQSNVTQYDAF